MPYLVGHNGHNLDVLKQPGKLANQNLRLEGEAVSAFKPFALSPPNLFSLLLPLLSFLPTSHSPVTHINK